MARARPYLIAVDLGGTKMLCAVLDKRCSVLHRVKKSTPAGVSVEKMVRALTRLIEQTIRESGLGAAPPLGVALGVPGIVNPGSGVVYDTPNLGLSRFPLRKVMRRSLRCPVIVENDVNAGTWGEYRFGPAARHRSLIGVFPGTGIGGALVIDRRLVRGAKGGAGELGHSIIHPGGRACGCGHLGCVEALSSRGALARDAVFLAAVGQSPTVLAEAGTDYRQVKSRVLYKAYTAGEPAIVSLVDTSVRYLGIALANSINLFNPDAVVVGGGLIEKFGDPYLEMLKTAVQQHALAPMLDGLAFYAASLGDDAVVRGAAALLLETLCAKG